MRVDLDDIKIDENGEFDIEALVTWGTKPLISILYGVLVWCESDGLDGNIVYHLIGTALEKATDFDDCIKRLVDEQKAEKMKERA